MDIRVNSVSFNGKKEIFYGLRKLAEESASYEIKRAMTIGPHPTSMNSSIAESKGKLLAYADMVMNDEFINQGLKEASNDKKLVKYYKRVLTQDTQQNISPLNVFKITLRNAAKKLNKDTKDLLNTFLMQIK